MTILAFRILWSNFLAKRFVQRLSWRSFTVTPSRTAVPSGAASAARTAPSTWKSAPSVSGAKRQDWAPYVSVEGLGRHPA